MTASTRFLELRERDMKIPGRPPLLIAVLVLTTLAGAWTQAPPEPPPLAAVSFPPYESMTLGNGLEVFVLEHDEQPVLSIQLVIGAGAANDPGNLPGLATFTAGLLETGTATRTAQEIAEAIDTSGGQLTVTPGREAITIGASVLKDTTDLAFELIRDLVMNPAFADEEIERLRQQSVSSITASFQDPDFVADTVFDIALYGSHPYSHPAGGTAASIGQISREDIVGFHQTWFAPEIAALAVVGDIAPDEAFDLARQWFGDWPRKNPPVLDLAEPEPASRNRVVIIDNPASVQTEIRIGQTTVARNAADYFPVLVTSYVLGGPEGRLMESLRSERGLTYGAYETITQRRGPGSLYATTETRTETTLEAIDAIFDEIVRLGSEPVPVDELEGVKSFIIGSFPLTIEVPPDLATRLTNLVVYDLGADYLETYRDRLAAVEVSDVARIASEHIRRDGMLIVLVGRAEAFPEGLDALGTVEVIPLAELDPDSPTLRRTPR